MSSVRDLPADYFYSPDHLWFCRRGEAVFVGLTELLGEKLGGVPTAELTAKAGEEVAAGQVVARITVAGKTVEVKSPFAGKVGGINAKLEADPTLLGSDPYGEGWLVTLDLGDAPPPSDLLPRQAYAEKFGVGE